MHLLYGGNGNTNGEQNDFFLFSSQSYIALFRYLEPEALRIVEMDKVVQLFAY